MNDNSQLKQRQKQFKYNKISYLLLGFNDGISTVSQLAINYHFKNNCGLSPSSLTQILTLIQLPLIFKPLFGLISDIFPIKGYRRKYYILICGIINSLSWFAMCFDVYSVFYSIFWLLLANASISFTSVLGQAILVGLSKEDNNKIKNSSNLVNLFFICKYIGIFLSSILKGYLVEKFSIKTVFVFSALLPIISIVSGLILIENKVNKLTPQRKSYITLDDSNNQTQISSIPKTPQIQSNQCKSNKSLWKKFLFFFIQTKILIPTLYIIFLLGIPNYKDTLFYYSIDIQNFFPNDFGIISIINTISTLIGIFIYNKFCFKLSFKMSVNLLHIGTVLSSFLYTLMLKGYTQPFISNFYFMTITSSLSLSTNELTLIPITSLTCALCPKDLEGSVNAMFVSAVNFGELLSGFLGSIITKLYGIENGNYHNFGKVVMTANVLEIIPIFVLLLIPGKYFRIEEEQTVKDIVIEMKDQKGDENKNNDNIVQVE
jgi:predicted MFS family arabinose efflux permease